MNVSGVQLPLTAPVESQALRVPAQATASPAFENALAKAESQRTESGRTASTVQVQRTALSAEDASEAISRAWEARFGEPPRAETVAVLTAQWAHETGNGQSMYNYNFAGLKGVGPSGLTVNQRTREGWGDSEVTIYDNFRAYRSAEEGAGDYLSLLSRRYPGAIDAAHQGDPAQFVRELKKGGYFTGNEAAYVRSVSSRTTQLLGRSPELTSGAAPQVTGSAATPGAGSETTVATRVPEDSGSSPSYVPSRISFEDLRAQSTRVQTAQAASTASDEAAQASLLKLQSFDDALSRAALRIAAGTSREEDRQT